MIQEKVTAAESVVAVLKKSEPEPDRYQILLVIKDRKTGEIRKYEVQ